MTTPSLYDRDILLWVEDTVAKLKSHDFEHLDLDNLIERWNLWVFPKRKSY